MTLIGSKMFTDAQDDSLTGELEIVQYKIKNQGQGY